MKVYLAGPISDLTFEVANSWREVATEALHKEGVEALSPLRTGDKEFTGPGGVRVTGETLDIGPMFTDRGIMVRDHWDVSRCDAVLIYLLHAEIVSIGTSMELAWAYAYRKPVVVVMEKEGNLHDHPMIREAIDYRVSNLEDAIEQILILQEA